MERGELEHDFYSRGMRPVLVWRRADAATTVQWPVCEVASSRGFRWDRRGAKGGRQATSWVNLMALGRDRGDSGVLSCRVRMAEAAEEERRGGEGSGEGCVAWGSRAA